VSPLTSRLDGWLSRQRAPPHSVIGFEKKYGPAAAHGVVAKIPAQHRDLVRANAPAIGILGARIYPYPFIGDFVRTMREVVNQRDEDAFVRELVYSGLDALVGTMHRVLVRWLVTPSTFLAKRQEVWELYHDEGTLDVLSQTEKDFVIRDRDWSNRDIVVCKINLEGRKRMLELMGLRGVEAVREKCRAWGDDVCDTRLRWT
jgi:hypothetical protein